MKSTFHRFVEKIVQQTDAPPHEKEDLYEELLIHLELSYEQLIKEGFSEQEASQRALEGFGDDKIIGNQIQQAMFPYRREMMLTLAFASILFSFAVYLSQLFIEGDAAIIWLVLSVVANSCLLVFSLQPMLFLNRRLWVNGLLLVHAFIYLLGVGFASSVDASISIVLTIWSWLILLLAIVLIYRTTIFDYESPKQKIKKQAKILHALNITTGVFIVAATLFFLWAVLVFSSEGFSPSILLIFIPLVIWIVSYIAQMRLLANERKGSAYIVAAIPLFIVLVLVIWWFWGIFY